MFRLFRMTTIAWAAFSALVFATSAQATVVVMHDLDQMTQRADVIVHARVFETHTVKEDGRIITLTTVEVIDGLKGARTGDILTIAHLGGEYQGERLVIVGNHKFEADEEMVFFGVNHTNNRVIAYGVGVGKFSVERDADGTKVVEQLGDIVAAEKSPDGRVNINRPRARRYESVDAFKQRIQGHLYAQETGLQVKMPAALGAVKMPQKPLGEGAH